MIELITSFYLPKNMERRNEIINSLKKNIKSKFISSVHLFVDSNECLKFIEGNIEDKEEIVIIDIDKQPLYSDLFLYANTLKNKVCMISNSDIFILNIKKLELLSYIKKNDNVIYAITRHEYDGSSPLIQSYEGSHDAFIFKSPINTDLLKHIHFKQNIWGSENVLIYELKKLGYKLYNPANDILLIHMHKDERRSPDRIKINKGNVDGDGVYKKRSALVEISSPFENVIRKIVRKIKNTS